MKEKEKLKRCAKFSVLTISILLLLSIIGINSVQAVSNAAMAVDTTVDHKELRSGGAVTPDTSVISPGPASGIETVRHPRVGPNIRVNAPQQGFPDGLLGRSETTITNVGNERLVAGFNDAQGFCGPPFGSACTPSPNPGLSGYAFSTNGGSTWTDGGSPPVINHAFTRGDPWLDSGGGTVYYANLVVDDTKKDIFGDPQSLGIGVHRGKFKDNKFVWNDLHTFDSPNNTITPDSDFYDKEAIAVSKDGRKDAYVSLTNFQALCGIPQFGFGQIEVWRTHDGGNTWQGPAIAGPEASDSVASCGNTGTLQQSSVPAIGPNGELYVVWQYGPTFTSTTSTDADIIVARSLDGGKTFNAPVKIADINSMRQNPPVGYNRNRINDHPRIAVATSGPNRGRVYVTFYSAVSPVSTATNEQSLVSSQIFLSYSDNKGRTWSKPKPIAPALPATGIKRFWPVVTIESGGNVDVVYYESQEKQATPDPNDIECNNGGRSGKASSLVDTYWVQSTDGGRTFKSPIKVSSKTSNWCSTTSNMVPNFGDYIGSASGGNHVFSVWADGRNGIPDVYFARIAGTG